MSMVLLPFAIINIGEGLQNLDQELLEMSQSFTRSRVRQFYRIIIPALFPFMFATMRISFGVAWKITLATELFGGDTGFGHLVNLGRQEFDTTLIFVVLILLVAFVYLTDRLVFEPLQKRVTKHYGPK
jgi:NitT/TauT family transport system permease protein/sulfonate transport system permease protein